MLNIKNDKVVRVVFDVGMFYEVGNRGYSEVMFEKVNVSVGIFKVMFLDLNRGCGE